MFAKLFALSSVLFPVVCLSAPATQPAAPAPPPRVLVLPFAPPADGRFPWVGRGVQQDLATDLTREAGAQVTAPASAAPAADSEAARNAGRDAGTAYVVFGQAQLSGPDMRFTGQVIDTATGNAVGSLKATGPAADLFPLEDSLSSQAASALPHPAGGPQNYASVERGSAVEYGPLTVPHYRSYSYSAYDPYPYPDYVYGPYAYPYYDGYPYYYGPYPWYDTGVFIYGGHFRHHWHDWDDWHHGGVVGRGGGAGHGTVGRPGAPHPSGGGHAGGIGRR